MEVIKLKERFILNINAIISVFGYLTNKTSLLIAKTITSNLSNTDIAYTPFLRNATQREVFILYSIYLHAGLNRSDTAVEAEAAAAAASRFQI